MRIGVDLGGTKIEAIAMNTDGAIVARERIATPADQGYEAIIKAVVDLALRLETAVSEPCTIGIGTPGAISPTTGVIKNSNTTCLNGRPLGDDLTRLFGRPIRLENDANCLALSEARDGAGRNGRCVFAAILGTGVGGGLVFDQKLWAGHQRIAGEWGHNVLESDGPLCYCGRRGCVETLLSGPALAADYARHDGPSGLDAETIIEAARGGEPAARGALDRYCRRLGQALSVVVNILDPDVIVLGGGLSAVAEIYADSLAALSANAFTDHFATPVVPALHGPASGVRGAAHLW